MFVRLNMKLQIKLQYLAADGCRATQRSTLSKIGDRTHFLWVVSYVSNTIKW
jgi:hypothetical protein